MPPEAEKASHLDPDQLMRAEAVDRASKVLRTSSGAFTSKAADLKELIVLADYIVGTFGTYRPSALRHEEVV